jgi:UDP-GlcNAc:undecaprenyl-phosphate GlcNAc-1-phosphate transferase|tara:strand:+ start:119777 stop:121102 length:1326 start_codon:yes stop_codon:yes gene_type:complete
VIHEALIFLKSTLFHSDFFYIFPTVFFTCIAGFSLLLMAKSFSYQGLTGLFKRAFHVPARKSTTNAVQLGGLPLSFGILCGVQFLYHHPNFSRLFSTLDMYSMKYWSVCAVIVMAYGYLDDRFELRPIIKLALQITSIGVFSVLESRILFHQWSALAFVITMFWGLGVLNGSNLLDGLDTLTIKIASVTYGTYAIIAFNFDIASTLMGAFVGISAIAAFYLFNKEPAKIHLGEIGGSFVGLFSLLLSAMLFTSMYARGYAPLSCLSMSLFPLSLPMTELGISFLRRIYNKKSPFSGDKYHIHHLLRNYYGMSPSKASSVFALSYAVVMVVSLGITHYFGPLIGIISQVIIMIGAYMSIGKKHWNGQDHLELTPASLFDYLLKKDVSVINSLSVDSFELEIVSLEDFKGEYQENRSSLKEEDSGEDHSDRGSSHDDTHKKAA